ncbi:MAG: hypothetical protein HC803_05345 [Saprospiraceae bacterium]|nr:hypothetical protein [Saprospiraceae bacterium]
MRFFNLNETNMYQTIINTNELNDLLGQKNLVVVDCRFSSMDKKNARNAYSKSHLPNAFYAHLDDDLSGEIIARKTGRHPFPSVEKSVNFVQLGELMARNKSSFMMIVMAEWRRDCGLCCDG